MLSVNDASGGQIVSECKKNRVTEILFSGRELTRNRLIEGISLTMRAPGAVSVEELPIVINAYRPR
jgi:hypothetical protein